jgi:hypothetical protein
MAAAEPAGETPKRFSTLLPGSTPSLEASELIDDKPKDEPK